MTDEDGLLVESLELPGDVLGDLADPVARQRICVLPRRLRRIGVARPARSARLVAVLAEELDPLVPRFAVEPQAMDEHDRRPTRFAWHDSSRPGACARFAPESIRSSWPGRGIALGYRPG